jgi:hypothetical protein
MVIAPLDFVISIRESRAFSVFRETQKKTAGGTP